MLTRFLSVSLPLASAQLLKAHRRVLNQKTVTNPTQPKTKPPAGRTCAQALSQIAQSLIRRRLSRRADATMLSRAPCLTPQLYPIDGHWVRSVRSTPMSFASNSCCSGLSRSHRTMSRVIDDGVGDAAHHRRGRVPGSHSCAQRGHKQQTGTPRPGRKFLLGRILTSGRLER